MSRSKKSDVEIIDSIKDMDSYRKAKKELDRRYEEFVLGFRKQTEGTA